MTKLRPLHDRVIVKQKKEAEMTAGGLYIPTNAQEKPLQGEVLAVGEGKMLDNGTIMPVFVKVGQTVLFDRHTYVEVELNSEKYLVIRNDNILGIVEPE